jgi:ribosome-associated translation inhibitor RaiA
MSGDSSPPALGTKYGLEVSVRNDSERDMQIQISSADSAMTEAIEAQILAQVKGLEDYINGLTGCTKCLQHLRFIVLEKAGRVRIHLDVSGGELTIDKQNSVDLPLAITQAFTAARAKLEEYVHKVRHDMKIEGLSPDVRVTTIFPTNDYGVLETIDGREIYFRRNSYDNARVGN